MVTSTIERLDALIVDLPTIRPHKLAMHTMRQQTLVILRLNAAAASKASARPPSSAAWPTATKA